MHPSTVSHSDKTPAFLRGFYLSLWVALATFHLTQIIWFSGWDSVPGGPGDGRLNNLILEHGYQALKGVYPFASPGQFFPTPDTLAYSDSHWGTLPIYLLARLFGGSTLTAYQVWAVFLGAANGFSVLFLLRVCRIPWPLAGPVCFLAVASAGTVWLVGGHIQLLPLFPLPLALAQILRWWETRRPVHLVLALGFFSWLNLASPYLGFFGALALILFAVLGLFLKPREREEPHPRPTGTTPKQWAAALLLLLLTTLPTLRLYALYFQQSRAGGTRPWSELADLAPNWQAWMTAHPVHWLYGGGWPEWTPLNLSEVALFSGWIPWLAMFIGLAMAWTGARSFERNLALIFALVAAAGILFFTDWTGDGDGIFLWLARKIEGFRAFRASGRVAIVVQLLQSLVFGLLLTVVWRRQTSVAARSLLIGLALAGVLETLCLELRGTSKETLEARRDAVLEGWRAAGDRPVLVFAPAPSNQDSSAVHLDAWAAALASSRHTINGYSGNLPDGYGFFLADPTEPKARDLVTLLGLDPDTISVVTSWGGAGPGLGLRQFDTPQVRPLSGFGLQPLRWDLTYPVESFIIDGQPVHQFTPKATVVFGIPAGARKIRFLHGMRKGAYTDGGDSDGVGLRLAVTSGPSGEEQEVLNLICNPRDREEDRGLRWINADLPATEDGRLILRVDYGPAGNGLWDWPVFGRLEVVE